MRPKRVSGPRLGSGFFATREVLQVGLKADSVMLAKSPGRLQKDDVRSRVPGVRLDMNLFGKFPRPSEMLSHGLI